jgi:hypothetical protein
VDADQAVAIAREILRKLHGRELRHNEASASEVDGFWHVTVWWLPRRQGGYTSVYVSKEGRAFNVVGGE